MVVSKFQYRSIWTALFARRPSGCDCDAPRCGRAPVILQTLCSAGGDLAQRVLKQVQVLVLEGPPCVKEIRTRGFAR